MQCKTQLRISSYTTGNIVAHTIAPLVQYVMRFVPNLASKPLVFI